MNDAAHDELRELIAPYVLGAVDDRERAMVRAHILSCEACMAEADGYSDVTSWLDQEVEPAAVPAGFADRVVAAVREESPAAAATPIPLPRSSRWQWLAAAAVLAVLGAMSLTLVQTRNDLDFQERVVDALVRGDGMTVEGSGAVGRMVPTQEGGIFVASGLQEAPGDHTYQLWLIDDDKPTSGGTFDVSDGVVAIDVDGSLEGVDTVAVTVEPDGGSPGPTSEPVMSS
jgi:anti-sigma-K factor RskA